MVPNGQCRLIRDGALDGPWNMAADEFLLQQAESDGQPCLRIYRWREPTLSLGYFQKIEQRQRHPPSAACPVVRRPSGGGAIIHDRELTYSIALPPEHPLARRRDALYQAVHQSLVDLLRDWGAAATVRTKEQAGCGTVTCGDGTGSEELPFLCFQRHCGGDVLIGGNKVAGSAQRRLRSAVLQHGSVLVTRSASAPELPGIANLADGLWDLEELQQAWLPRLEGALSLAWVEMPFTTHEERRITEIASSKYAQIAWTEKRTRNAEKNRCKAQSRQEKL